MVHLAAPCLLPGAPFPLPGAPSPVCTCCLPLLPRNLFQHHLRVAFSDALQGGPGGPLPCCAGRLPVCFPHVHCFVYSPASSQCLFWAGRCPRGWTADTHVIVIVGPVVSLAGPGVPPGQEPSGGCPGSPGPAAIPPPNPSQHPVPLERSSVQGPEVAELFQAELPARAAPGPLASALPAHPPGWETPVRQTVRGPGGGCGREALWTGSHVPSTVCRVRVSRRSLPVALRAPSTPVAGPQRGQPQALDAGVLCLPGAAARPRNGRSWPPSGRSPARCSFLGRRLPCFPQLLFLWLWLSRPALCPAPPWGRA